MAVVNALNTVGGLNDPIWYLINLRPEGGRSAGFNVFSKDDILFTFRQIAVEICRKHDEFYRKLTDSAAREALRTGNGTKLLQQTIRMIDINRSEIEGGTVYRKVEDAAAKDKLGDFWTGFQTDLSNGLQIWEASVQRSGDEAERKTAIGVRAGLEESVRRRPGQDYFGHTEDFVPLGSPSVYLQPFNEALALLADRETRYLNYTSHLAQKKALTEEREKAIEAATNDLITQQTTLDTLTAAMDQLIEKQIPAHDDAIINARRSLLDALKNLSTAIECAPGLTPEDFINCLFNLAFIGDPTTPHPTAPGALELAGHGVFTGITTISSQAATLINKAVNTLPDDEGQPVNRKHLLSGLNASKKS